ncbi:MAG: hypothetical protein ACRDSL_11340 [Pseudonocardiaceae bacterium]
MLAVLDPVQGEALIPASPAIIRNDVPRTSRIRRTRQPIVRAAATSCASNVAPSFTGDWALTRAPGPSSRGATLGEGALTSATGRLSGSGGVSRWPGWWVLVSAEASGQLLGESGGGTAPHCRTL